MKTRALFLFLILLSLASVQQVFATYYDVEIVATVPGCGDSIIQSGEQCDGANFGGATCSNIGFTTGSLSCSSVCTLVTAACVLVPQSSSQSQTIRSEGSDDLNVETNLVVTGYYAPNARISLLKDGQVAATTFTNERGFFQITVSRLSIGEYRIMLVGEGQRGAVVSEIFVGKIFKDSTTMISGIYLPPDPAISIEGQSVSVKVRTVPNSEVILEVGEKQTSYMSDEEGNLVVTLPYSSLADSVNIRVGLKHEGIMIWSSQRSILPPAEAPGCTGLGDVTDDCRVSFVDFAIMLWWYLYNPSSSEIDLDGNGKLDLVDFSILGYYWTG